MSDLVERLNNLAGQRHMDRGLDAVDDALREAASRISQQDAELERLRRELEEAESERVRLWNENRDLRGSIDVEKAVTDSVKREMGEARRIFEKALNRLKEESAKDIHLASLDAAKQALRAEAAEAKLAEARKAAFSEAAEIAEGPPYKEHYRGDENGNWTSYSDYGRGRFAAAAAIRAKAEETRR